MNRLTVSALILLAGTAAPALAQFAGPSTAQTSYMVPSNAASGVRFISFASNGNNAAAGRPDETFMNLFTGVNDYRMVGVPDGMGAFRTEQDIRNGTSTFLVNHEIGATLSTVRAHGNTGAFVSQWRVVTEPSRSDFLRVIGGADLSTQTNLWNGTGYTAFGPGNAAPAGFNRYCSGDLAPVSAFQWTDATGRNFGTAERIFLNGEETGAEGRAMAHVVTGAEARQSYELPSHGRYSWENNVANPLSQRTTIVAGTDDATPGNVYFYVGQKQETGNTIERAGLTNGSVYGVVVNDGNNTMTAGQRVEDRANVYGNAATGRLETASFSLSALPDQRNISGATLQTQTDAARQMNFLRPEDSAWNPSNPSQLFIATTDSFTGNSRLHMMTFTDITQPTLGGSITMLADGSNTATITGGYTSATGLSDVRMMDNIAVSRFNQVLIQEDVGNNARLGRLWLYDVIADSMTEIGISDSSRFLAGGANFQTQDEETSGIIDAYDIIGPGWWLMNMQAHYGIAGELVEGGQLISVFIPQTVPTPAGAAVLALGGLLAARRRRSN